jgi:predicted CoA-binding protein
MKSARKLAYLCGMTDKSSKKTLVMGASDNPARYSYLAINRLREEGHPVLAIGSHKATVGDVEIDTSTQNYNQVDTVTMYLNPNNQKGYYQYLLSLKPRRIIFNPGAENPELEELARKNGIKVQEACTLVLLSTGQF